MKLLNYCKPRGYGSGKATQYDLWLGAFTNADWLW